MLGGVLLEFFWWGSVFLIGAPVMVLLLVVGPSLLPEYRDPDAGRLDLASAALATYALGTFVAFGVFIFIAQHLQLVLGMGPLEAGLWTVPFAGAFIVGSMLTPMMVRRIRPGYLMAAGLGLASVGFVLLTQVDERSGVGLLVTGFVVYSLGLAPVFTLATDLVVGSAPPERAGSASAISETASEFGGALGIAILGSIGTAVYRGQMAESVPAGIPPATAEAARETLGGAVSLAARMPEPLGAALIGTARDAFAQSFEVVAAALLRRARAHAEPERQAEPVPLPAR